MRHFIGLLALFSFFYPAQTQQVTKEFSRMLVDDDFSRLAGKWEQLSNTDNSFVGLERGFQTWRRNTKSGFFILSQEPKEFSVFESHVHFTFDPKGGNNQSAGMVLQAQADGSGALVIEINKKKQYRILRAVNNRLIAVTGEGEGWVKNKKAITNGENVVMVRTYDKIYDLIINGIYVITFTEIEYSRGQIGLYIGPGSKVVFHRLQVKTDDDHVASEGASNGSVDEEKTLSQVIVKLKETINKKDKRIAELEAEVRSLSGRGIADTVILRQKQEAESRLLVCNRELDAVKLEKMVMENKLKELQEFKELVRSNENGDVIINLTNLTSSQKLQIEGLQSEIRGQQSTIEQLKNEKTELQNVIKQKNADNDQLRNDQVDLLQRIIEKDSVIMALEEKNTLLDESLVQCNRNIRKNKPEAGTKPRIKRKKKTDPALFDE